MLAVVKNKKCVPGLDPRDEMRERIALGRQREPKRLRNRRENVLAIRERREFDQPNAVARPVVEIRCNL